MTSMKNCGKQNAICQIIVTKKIYGGVAFIIADGASDRMAEKQGFFVIRATGNSSSIINQKDFKPKAF